MIRLKLPLFCLCLSSRFDPKIGKDNTRGLCINNDNKQQLHQKKRVRSNNDPFESKTKPSQDKEKGEQFLLQLNNTHDYDRPI